MANGLSIIDSHAHLDYPQFEGQVDEVLRRAKALGVTEVISIGVKLSTADKPRQLAETHDNVWFSAGIHPHEASNEPDACNLQSILVAANHPKCVAIGEAGLDYFYDNAPRKAQADSFRVQIEAARQTGKPIIVHARDADADMAEILETEMLNGAFTGVLHCFSSGSELARRAVDIGFYISFSGILTFGKAQELRQIASELPAERLLVETDSPYLAPTPFRGKTNEPGYTRHVLERLAEVRNTCFEHMAEQTRQNTLRLFTHMSVAKAGA
tara:strand:+ start:567 stop:1376 length:810 start_codon:yes stop_codon:yes gene_type:complete